METQSLAAAALIWLALCGPPLSADTGRLEPSRESEQILLDAWKEDQRNGRVSVGMARIGHHLGALYYDLGRYDEAEAFFRKSLSIWPLYAVSHPAEYAASTNALATLLLDRRRHHAAEALYRKTMPEWRDRLPPDDPTLARCWGNLGSVQLMKGKQEEAARLFALALRIIEQTLGAEHPDLIPELNNLAVVYARIGRMAEAGALLERVIEIDARNGQRAGVATLSSKLNMAELLCRQGKFAESDALYLATLAEVQENLGGEHPIVAEAATQYAESLRRMDRKSDAKRLDRFARERRKAQSLTNGFTINVGDLRDGRD